MQKSILFSCIFCLLITVLNGCDWHLRGSGGNHLTLPKTFLEAGSSPGEDLSVYREIHSILMRQGTLSSRNKADVQLVLGKQTFNKRTISMNRNARAAEFQLALKVPFKILNQQGTVLQASTASITRSYRFNEQDILGKDKEEELLKKEMIMDVAHQILSQL
jgi:LPS-assembly lipoprotein